MSAQVIRIADYERRSKNPDAAQPRNPVDADVFEIAAARRNLAHAIEAIENHRLDDSVPVQIR
jgi:hypothetical protein